MINNKFFDNYLPEIFYLKFLRKIPNAVSVNLTDKCNQHCIYCEIGMDIKSSRKGYLTKDDLKWIIDQMSIIKIRKLALCGGEPFLFDGIFDIIEYAGKKKIRCSITTNGMTMHKLKDRELDIFIRNNTQINISIDSFKENIQTFTRGNALALKNSIESIKRLSERSIPVTLLCAISKYNFHDLFNYFRSAYERGVKQVLFQPIIYYSNFPDRNPLEQKSTLNVETKDLELLLIELNKILYFEKKHKISTNVYRILPWITNYLQTASDQNGKWFFDGILKKFYCRDIYAIIDISYDGGIQPCGLSLASVSIHENRHLGLMKLWSNATKTIKDDLKKGKYPIFCNGCCHHFSRNMIASIIKYPIINSTAFCNTFYILSSRLISRTLKRIMVIK